MSRGDAQSGRGLGGWSVVVLLAFLLPALAGCGSASSGAGGTSAGRVRAVTPFYPVTWVVEAVGGDRVQVRDLTPTGVEPHDLEPTADDVDAILDADVVFVMGHDFQPSVEKVAAKRDGGTVTLLHHGTKDPHVWLDPVRMRSLVADVETGLRRADPAGAATFRRNAARVEAELETLHEAFERGLSHCSRRVLVTSHQAFGYLASRYGLRQQSIAGLSPENEPSADRLAELADLARRTGTTTIFTEDAVSPRIAETLAREAGGLRTEVLSPLETLTTRQRSRGEDYLSVMRSNLTKLERALDCSPSEPPARADRARPVSLSLLQHSEPPGHGRHPDAPRRTDVHVALRHAGSG